MLLGTRAGKPPRPLFLSMSDGFCTITATLRRWVGKGANVSVAAVPSMRTVATRPPLQHQTVGHPAAVLAERPRNRRSDSPGASGVGGAAPGRPKVT